MRVGGGWGWDPLCPTGTRITGSPARSVLGTPCRHPVGGGFCGFSRMLERIPPALPGSTVAFLGWYTRWSGPRWSLGSLFFGDILFFFFRFFLFCSGLFYFVLSFFFFWLAFSAWSVIPSPTYHHQLCPSTVYITLAATNN